MFSRIISAPFYVLVFIFGYQAWMGKGNYIIYTGIAALIIFVIHILSPEINWRWYQRYPQKLDKKLQRFLDLYHYGFLILNSENQKLFKHRLHLYMIGVEFRPQGITAVGEDIKAICAATAAQLTIKQQNFLLHPFEHVIVYGHPFPSPQYPNQLHASEMYKEDGVIIFCGEHLLKGFMEPKKYFHIAYYEYAKVFMDLHPNLDWPQYDEGLWAHLEQISHFKKSALEKYIGLKNLNVIAVAIAHYFVFRDEFREELPSIFEKFEHIF